MIKKRFIVEVCVDENIQEKYPNFRFNWESIDEFIYNDIGFNKENTKHQKKQYKDFGHSKIVIKEIEVAQ